MKPTYKKDKILVNGSEYLRQVFIIYGTLPTLNEVININRGNKYSANNLKKKTDKRVIKASQYLEPLVNKANFKITFVRPNRRTDKDNLLIGSKFIFDGLQRAEIIPNDGWNEIGELAFDFQVDKEEPKTIIEILEEI